MSERDEDWNALFDPATEAPELARIAAAHPEFAEQARRHANWVVVEAVAVLPPPPAPPQPAPPSPAPSWPPVAAAPPVAPVYPPAPTAAGYATGPVPPTAYPAYPTGPVPPPAYPLAPVAKGARLTAGERGWWLVVGLVWLLSYASSMVLPSLGVQFVSGAFGDAFLTQLLWVAIAFEAVPFVIAIIAVLATGRGAGRKAGAAIVLVVGLGLLAGALWQLLPLQFVQEFGFLRVEGPFHQAAYTAVPVTIEIAAGAIAYTIASGRRWHTLWTIPIGFGLLFGAYFFANALASWMPVQIAYYLVVGIGVLIRLLVVVLAGALGSRREPLPPYAAPAYTPRTY